MSEQTEFLKDLDIAGENVLDAPITGSSEPEKESTESQELQLKNRRERRLAEKWQKERESNIALNARLEALSESQKIRETTEEADYLKRVAKIYGDATPEAKEATELLKEALRGVHESARKEALTEALETFNKDKKERDDDSKAVEKEENEIEEGLERIEDEFNVDFSDQNTRKGFLTLLEKLSPKDRDGNIKEYADFITAYEVYESQKSKSSSRAKELASRSMTHGGASQESKLQDDATIRFLKENDII